MATIKSPMPDAERTAGSLHRDGCAALVRYWTERRTRKLHNAAMFAQKGDYASAQKEASEAEGTLRCLEDLNEEMRHNAEVSEAADRNR